MHAHTSTSVHMFSPSPLFLSFTYAVDLTSSDSNGVALKALTVTLASTVFSGCISFVALFITSINIWFNSKGCLTGPTAVYLLNFGASKRSDLQLAALSCFTIQACSRSLRWLHFWISTYGVTDLTASCRPNTTACFLIAIPVITARHSFHL